ncbi:MAG TPA: thioredoxin domain-containing protein [Pyrinomonadaceae bacterium]|jgi:protein-disulfide isomerase
MRKFVTAFLITLAACAAPAAFAQRPAAGAPARPAATPAPRSTPRTPAPSAAGTSPAPAAAAATPAAEEDCGCDPEPPPEVLGVVNGVRIGTKEVDQAIDIRIRELRQNVVEARKRELNLQINSILLEAEAKKRGTTTTKLIESEIIAKTQAPTEAEARAFYDQNKARIGSEWSNELRDQIISYLRDQKQGEYAKQLADRLRAASAVKQNVAEATPPATPSDRGRVFAVVNGTPVTSAMVEDSLKPLVYAVQRQIYDLRKQQLDMRVNDLLLNQESQKRQMTSSALLDAEVMSKLKPVTEADARAFYDQNKERINGTFEQVKTQVIQYLQDQRRDEALGAYAGQLRQSGSVQTFLREPTPPVYEIATDDQPARGAATAPVTIVEFTDYQCPTCAAQQPVLERIVGEYGERVRLVIRDFPLAQHANAQKAAEAAEAARAQGKYWEYVPLLFANQTALDVPKLKEYATRAGLDRAKFDAMLDSGQFAEKVARDLNDGNRIGVNATPTIFVNGRPLTDRSYEGLKSAVEAALKEKKG